MAQYTTGQWNLGEMLGGKDLDYHINRIKELSFILQGYNVSCQYKDNFRTVLDLHEEIGREIELLDNYRQANSWSAIDSNAEIISGRCLQATSQARVALTPFHSWWTGLESEISGILYQEGGPQQRYLERLSDKKPYMLSEQAEKALKISSDNMLERWKEQYNTALANIRFPISIGGQTIEATFSEAVKKWFSNDPEERKASYSSVMQTLEKNSELLGKFFIGKGLIQGPRILRGPSKLIPEGPQMNRPPSTCF